MGFLTRGREGRSERRQAPVLVAQATGQPELWREEHQVGLGLRFDVNS